MSPAPAPWAEGAWQERAFALRPFGRPAAELGLALTGRLARQGEWLRVLYLLRGDLDAVCWPEARSGAAERADGLWQHTCFELFLAAEGAAPYWEVNLSPSGAWNLYRLDAYRRGLRPESDRVALPFVLRRTAEGVELELELALPADLARACQERALRLGVSAVIERREGELSYWALAHGGAEADFHRREDFLLRLEPS
jgi:hypothetical protein